VRDACESRRNSGAIRTIEVIHAREVGIAAAQAIECIVVRCAIIWS
jgi:hypothetical protein